MGQEFGLRTARMDYLSSVMSGVFYGKLNQLGLNHLEATSLVSGTWAGVT